MSVKTFREVGKGLVLMIQADLKQLTKHKDQQDDKVQYSNDSYTEMVEQVKKFLKELKKCDVV